MDLEPDSLDSAIGRRIRELRLAAGLSQTEFAAQVRRYGVSVNRAGIDAIEAGRRRISVGEFDLWKLYFREGYVAADGNQDAVDPLPLGGGSVALTDAARAPVEVLRRSLIHGEAPGQHEYDIPIAAPSAAGNPLVDVIAEEQIAKRFKVTLDEVVQASYDLWGSTLAEKRNAEAQIKAEPGTTRRSLQAMRAYIARELRASLASEISRRKRQSPKKKPGPRRSPSR